MFFSVLSSLAHLALCFRAVIFLAVRGEDMLKSSLALQRGSCERRDMFIFPAPTRTSNALGVSASQRGISVPLAAPWGAPEPLQAACFTLQPPRDAPACKSLIQLPGTSSGVGEGASDARNSRFCMTQISSFHLGFKRCQVAGEKKRKTTHKGKEMVFSKPKLFRIKRKKKKPCHMGTCQLL